MKTGVYLRFVDVHEMLALWGQSEELESPLLSENEVTYWITHNSCLSNLSIAHIEIFLQDLIDLPALHIYAKMLLQDPPDLVCAANMIRLQHHLLDYLPNCWTPVSFLYIRFPHFFKYMPACLHFPDNLAHPGCRYSVLLGNSILLIADHNGFVSNLQDLSICKLGLVLDPLPLKRWCLFYPVGRIKISIPNPCNCVPAAHPLCESINSLQVGPQAPSSWDFELQCSLRDLSSESGDKLRLHLQLFNAKTEPS